MTIIAPRPAADDVVAEVVADDNQVAAALASFALVERFQTGDRKEAFAEIYRRYYDTIFRYAYFRIGHRQLAEDLAQTVFERALRRLDMYTWQDRDLGAWLVTITRNLIADHFKSARYRLEITTADVFDVDRVDPRAEFRPDVAAVDYLTNVALLEIVQQLTPEQREVIVLRFLRGLSVAETAHAMGRNAGAIKAMQYRAVRAMAKLGAADLAGAL